jgi:hypothetical protein
MPDGLVSGIPDGGDRKALLRRFQFLQADEVGLKLLQPGQEYWQSPIDAIHVVGGDPQEAQPHRETPLCVVEIARRDRQRAPTPLAALAPFLQPEVNRRVGSRVGARRSTHVGK